MATRSTIRSPWKASRAGSPKLGLNLRFLSVWSSHFVTTFYPRVELQMGILSLSLLLFFFVSFPSFIPFFFSLFHFLPPFLFLLGKG